MRTVIIVGGGAAGMFAAYSAKLNDNNVILLEKNEKLGKKLYITGKGRCNLTNNVPYSEFLNNVVHNPKFLFSSLNELSPQNVIDFFEINGCPIKTERGNRVFPSSDKSSDVIKTLKTVLEKLGVDIRLNTKVVKIETDCNKVIGVKTENSYIPCDSVIVCTGGISYPLTGSTGDGYKFAQTFGHTIISPKPSLVGLELKGSAHLEMQGLSLKNVAISVLADEKEIYNDFGEMLFTHFGVSGPVILSASCILNRFNAKKFVLKIDLKPALDFNTLDNRLVRELEEGKTKTVFNTMRSLLPQSLIPEVLRRAKIAEDKRCCDINKNERLNIVSVLKGLHFEIKGLRPVDEAIVTAGGVSVKEINPKTMESRIVNGLFFAGEVLDVDAFTGGFNIQIAFSTGFVAGNHA